MLFIENKTCEIQITFWFVLCMNINKSNWEYMGPVPAVVVPVSCRKYGNSQSGPGVMTV